MKWVDHDDEEKIPEGKAMLWMDNNGWVGTNNGWPMVGQPALYPRSQAIAISQAMTLLNFLGEEKVRELIPCPDDMHPEFFQWVFGRQSHNHDK